MDAPDIKKLLVLARKYIKRPDVVIDVYDMTFVWVSRHQCKILGYSEKEQIEKQIAINTELVEGDARRMATEAISCGIINKRDIILKTKSGGRILASVENVVLEFNGQPYMIGKIYQVRHAG